MWDLDELTRRNNQYALEEMMEGKQTNEAQQPAPEAWALSILTDRMKIGPPSLAALMSCFSELKVATKFDNLINDYLPGHKAEIMREPFHRRVYKFCYLFSNKQFPLPRGSWEYRVDELVGSLPVNLMGLSLTAYHDLGMRIGYLLLLSLLPYPFEGIDGDQEDDPVPFSEEELPKTKYKPNARDTKWLRDLILSLSIGGEWIAPMGFKVVKVDQNTIKLSVALDKPDVKEVIARTLLIARQIGLRAEFDSGRSAEEKMAGPRVPLLDMVKGIVGIDLLSRIPKDGFAPSEIYRLTKDSKYSGASEFAAWAFSETDTVMLDANYGDCNYIEGDNDPIFEWSPYNVKLLAKQWPRVQEIRGRIDKIVLWLERDPRNNFKELLEFLLREPVAVNVRAKTKDWEERLDLCKLEQPIEDDEED